MRRVHLGLTALTLAGSILSAAHGELLDTSVLLRSAGEGTQAPRAASEFSLNRIAKILCSAVFVSERELDEALHNSARRVLPDADWRRLASRSDGNSDVGIDIDRDNRTVRATLGGFSGRAKHHGDQGCVILPAGLDEVFFKPVSIQSSLPDPTTQPWPMGDRLPDPPSASPLDARRIRQAVDAAFEGGGLTAAFVAVHQGQIIAERYGQGADKDTQLESWSMGKSLTATLVGILVQQGHLSLDSPAPVRLWHEDAADPRAQITVSDLLRMSSGLRFTHASQPAYEWGRGVPDHLYVYAAAIDAFDLSITRPAEFPPGTVGRYRNSDPLTLGYIIRQTVEGLGEDYLSWPQAALFDRIGIRRQVLETDAYGNFLLTGHDFGTGRNWARLGLLYLRDGIWNGDRLLPDGWVDFVSTPAPAWVPPVYGGLFWVNSDGRWNAPRSTYYMSGAGGQEVIIVPTHDLVVARLGHSQGSEAGQAALNVAVGKLIEAIEVSQ
ncbi:MAG TPA: serine hydrolase [Acidobacteriota bacterium]|nr:serine hydrolase [Acidobacteriota bacterium]